MLYNYGFTISLSDDFEGGEFVLQTEAGEIGYKVNKGEVVIFPIIYPHKVTKVTKGCRQNIIGWFESKVTYEQAYILKVLDEFFTHILIFISAKKKKNLQLELSDLLFI